jgi:hypothetical protein
MVSVTQGANQADHLQPELALGQCESAFLLGSASLVVELALAVDAPTNHQPQTHHSGERGDGADAVVGHPQLPLAARAVVVERFEPQFGSGLGTGLNPGHGSFSVVGERRPNPKESCAPGQAGFAVLVFFVMIVGPSFLIGISPIAVYRFTSGVRGCIRLMIGTIGTFRAWGSRIIAGPP